MNWNELVAQRMHSVDTVDRSALTPGPDLISFGGGVPAPELFPIDEFAAAYQEAITSQGRGFLGYGPTEGIKQLREDIAALMARHGSQVDPADIMITNGAYQALDITARVLLEPGDTIAVDGPTFLGALGAWRFHSPKYIVIDTDDFGTQVEDLAAQLKAGARPKFIYSLPTFHNPAGVTMTVARRQRLLELSNEYEIPILEDDPYSEISFDGAPPSPMRAMPGGENVIYVSTFSKFLAPGIRLGWMVRPKNGARYFGAMKSASDLSTDQLLQLAVHRLFARLNIVSEIDRLRAAYADRAVMMLAAMEKHFRPDVQWTKPKGGFFIWVTLPEGANAGEMLRQAMAGGVTYAAGQAFFANGKGQNTLRLCYSQASHDQIETGIQRLAAVIDRHLEEKGIRSDARVPVR